MSEKNQTNLKIRGGTDVVGMVKMNIPKINDFLPNNPKKYIALRLALSISLGAGFIVWYMSMVHNNSFIALTWPFFTAFVCYGCTGIAIDEFRYNQAKRKYKEKLQEVELSLLVELASSPEMTKDERSLIIEHLNATNPGWSICAKGH